MDVSARQSHFSYSQCDSKLVQGQSFEVLAKRDVASMFAQFEFDGLLHMVTLEAKACSKVHHTVDDLKSPLKLAWQELPQAQLRASVKDV